VVHFLIREKFCIFMNYIPPFFEGGCAGADGFLFASLANAPRSEPMGMLD
jgi:hypothetical protein